MSSLTVATIYEEKGLKLPTQRPFKPELDPDREIGTSTFFKSLEIVPTTDRSLTEWLCNDRSPKLRSPSLLPLGPGPMLTLTVKFLAEVLGETPLEDPKVCRGRLGNGLLETRSR